MSHLRGVLCRIEDEDKQMTELASVDLPLCWPLRSSAPSLLSVPHHGTGVIRRSRHEFHAAVSAARADALAILARSSRARMSQTVSTPVCGGYARGARLPIVRAGSRGTGTASCLYPWCPDAESRWEGKDESVTPFLFVGHRWLPRGPRAGGAGAASQGARRCAQQGAADPPWSPAGGLTQGVL